MGIGQELSTASQKKQLRKQFLRQRQQLSPSEWHSKSKQICQHLLASSLIKKADLILAYCSFKQEPNLNYLFQHHQGLWGLPRCEQKNLIWHQWQWGDDLTQGKYGINQSLSSAPLINPSQVDLILIPALACDHQGYRLGYGAGYYDRMLASPSWQNIPTIGIVFDFAYVTKLIRDKWDQPLNYVCTEIGMIKLCP